MSVPQTVLTLIENFERNLDAYRTGQYNETQVRRDFIDPMFKALGWDMDNSQGYAETYRDVIHEDAIKVGLSTRAPDYSFRIGGARKFFLEAKKPSVNVKEAIEPAFQVRRYAWSSKLPLSIVTDFEEFAIYDCRQKPDKNDKASQSRLFYCTFRDYPEKWDEIAAIFSKDAVLKGSFDKYASSTKGKRGTTAVDSAFLAEIEGWRDLLARNIALRNTSLSQRELNFAVQQTIDRIIFLRICEDRGIEPYGKLMALQNGVNVYDRLRGLFRAADERYNSGLFHFTQEKGRAGAPDELTLHLSIDDKPLKEIFKNLYYPDCPYEFSVLGADILGSVYEQFLGKVIRLTAGNRAVVEDKPEVKKAGGVFYTPAYIVQYIVQHTVGKLLEGKTSKQAAGITILDPACGSGSFLIGAYQYLLDWYLARYVAEGADKHSKGKEAPLRPFAQKEWRLTTSEKKRILLEHIYGVDIDAQAVEVTKLSLLLKVLEGESGESLNSQMKLFHERVLPDLDRNIQCGNSLIAPDFYDSQLDLDTETAQRINVFDWQAGFPHIFKAGGFDAVIGNPPWVSLTGKFGNEICDKSELDYLQRIFDGNSYMPNMYEFFIAQGLRLSNKGGVFSFIVPDRFGHNNQFNFLRRSIVERSTLREIIYNFPFPGITADTMVFVIERGVPQKNHQVVIGEYGKNAISQLQSEILKNAGCAFQYFSSSSERSLINSLKSRPGVLPLSEICETTSGFGGKSSEIFSSKISSLQQPIIKGDCIGRYAIKSQYWFQFVPSNITGRTTDKTKLGATPKILLRKTGNSLIATIDTSGKFPEQSLYFLFNNKTPVDFKYLLGLLNSKLLNFYFTTSAITNRNSIAQLKKVDLDQFPIKYLDLTEGEARISHDKIVALVEKMLALHEQFAVAKTPQDTTLLQRQITATDRQIDQLVYALYGLTDEEIALVEKT
ncbi:MAG: N-6 DNA methylase [Nitrosospira sp.]|nr:N-6 DNA methylase [Nitrosospira sp.]